jgi:hypothetical protein
MKSKYFFAAILIAITSFSFIYSAPNVNADGSTKGNIIDDVVFDNEASMTEAQIQDFINKFPNSCLSPQNQPGDLGSAMFKTPIDYWTYGESDSSPAHIISWAANYYHLNPQVILSTLEKEENLVSGIQGCANYRYNSAMGYDCPDNLTIHNYADIGIYQTCVQRASNAGFVRQVSHATWQLRFDKERAYGNTSWGDDGNVTYSGRMTQGYRARLAGGVSTYYDGYTTIDSESVYITNGATAALYNYTPHFNSFHNIFTGWFGSAYGSIYNGIDYSAVYDFNTYTSGYADLKAAFDGNTTAAIAHFVNYGIGEGRIASSNFNVTSYKNRYPDLRMSFGNNLRLYYLHYINSGKAEGRTATGETTLIGITNYNGIDYSAVYDFNTYISGYADLKSAFGNDDIAAIAHFVNCGISEGRIANSNFNVTSYKNRYYDLRRAFGNNMKAYYTHYINSGKSEGRIATGDDLNGTSVYNGIDYSAVYNFNAYVSGYADLKVTFGSDDAAAIAHFVNCGMNEGRIASSSFNVRVYKNNYSDLNAVFGNNLKAYYMHYINNGKSEGRIAV